MPKSQGWLQSLHKKNSHNQRVEVKGDELDSFVEAAQYRCDHLDDILNVFFLWIGYLRCDAERINSVRTADGCGVGDTSSLGGVVSLLALLKSTTVSFMT